jgi:hypothetical protein
MKSIVSREAAVRASWSRLFNAIMYFPQDAYAMPLVNTPDRPTMR